MTRSSNPRESVKMKKCVLIGGTLFDRLEKQHLRTGSNKVHIITINPFVGPYRQKGNYFERMQCSNGSHAWVEITNEC
jgi:hypothetical protein